jgi:tRNA dimethylallyltransferase
VDKANPNRLMRALEVCITTGETFTSLRKNQSKARDFNIIKIGLNRPREELFENISARAERMIADGLVEEVTALLPFRHHNALNTVGYKEIFDFLDKKVTLERAIENIKTNTRRYAKRQLTWFKRDKEIRWFLPEETEDIIRYSESKTPNY